jgi:hypothetical protein
MSSAARIARTMESACSNLSDRLQDAGMSRVEPRELRRYRQFYLVYSRIWESLTPEFVLAGTTARP